MQETWQTSIKKRLIETYVHSEQEWVDLNISTSGLLNLTVVSNRFQDVSIPERRRQISNSLGDYNKSLGFLSLYTISEADSLKLPPSQITNGSLVQTWQDLALWAANPQNQPQPSQQVPHFPRTVTFYSFKGGVGRTTALTHVAWILAMRGRKVVAVDLDLEAPGLSTAFNLDPYPPYGIVDYFYERAYLPEEVSPSVPITQIFGEVRIPNATGRLFIVHAGFLSLDYISKVEDLRATAVTAQGETLWSIFEREIQEQLKPDIILIDSRTGINEWGAFSLLQAADEAIIFLFPNEQNKQGINLLIDSLQSFGNLSVNFVLSPVPVGEINSSVGKANLKELWESLYRKVKDETGAEEAVDASDSEEDNNEDLQSDLSDPLLIPYLEIVASSNYYPVTGVLDYYNRIANLIDADTNKIRIEKTLQDTHQRWEIIESLNFPALNAADQDQENYRLLFQRTADFERFLDETTCLIRGRKGTGKTELYLLLLQHDSIARQLARGRLDNVSFLSGHGRFHSSRPSRNEFEIIDQELTSQGGTWESFWRSYLLLRIFQDQDFKKTYLRINKFEEVKNILSSLSARWQSEHTQALIQLSIEPQFRLILPDALDILNNKRANQGRRICFLYDDLDEDFTELGGIRQRALTGLFQLIQSCDARQLMSIRFKIFLREDIWSRLNFDNKSHFNGRDISLHWTRVDFLRLALRQAIQSSKFKDLVDRSFPVDNIDQASEESIERALELLWGSRRRRGSKAKYVSRWVYERLTDSGNTTFPRSLSALLQGAKQQELTYKGQSSIQPPTDRLLRGKSLEVGLEKASEERCDAIRQEYPKLCNFFDSLEGVQALPTREDLKQIWQGSAQEVISTFDDFSDFIGEIGLAKWRTKEERYSFADIYVYGFKMIRTGTK